MQGEWVSGLYAAATGRVDWHQPLEGIVSALRLWAVQVIGIDKRHGTVICDLQAGQLTPQCALDYLRFHHDVNPRVAPMLALQPGQWLHDHEHSDDAAMAAHPLWRESLLPHGGKYLSGTKIVEDEAVVFLLGLMRSAADRPLQAADMPLAESVRHHAGEAFRNYLHLRRALGAPSGGVGLLDRCAQPVLLLDEAQGICHRNPAAVRLLREEAALSDVRGTLVCRDRSAGAELAAAVAALKVRGEGPVAGRRVVRLAREGTGPLLLFVSAIHPSASLQMFGPTVRYLVIAHDPAQLQGPPEPWVLGECFGFTPAEARVAAALACGHDVKEIAQRFRSSVNTVRSHVRAVLEKSGTSRQADLVRLLLSLPGQAGTPWLGSMHEAPAAARGAAPVPSTAGA